MHIQKGAKAVLIPAPAKNVDKTILNGVNHRDLIPDDTMVSNGSCTTNCLTPLAKVLIDALGIDSGIITKIHCYTVNQPNLDRRPKDLSRTPVAAMAMIPTSTGVAMALGEVLPELSSKLDVTECPCPRLMCRR